MWVLAKITDVSLSYGVLPGVEVDPKNIDSIRTGRDPSLLQSLRVSWVLLISTTGFLGIFRYCCSINIFNKDVAKFEWFETCEKIFKELNDWLTFAPVLTLIRSGEGYVEYYGASWVGLGCILMQDGMVIAYASRRLKIH